MTELSRAMLTRALGEYLLTYLEENPFCEKDVVERECAWVLHQIVKTLNDETLTVHAGFYSASAPYLTLFHVPWYRLYYLMQ